MMSEKYTEKMSEVMVEFWEVCQLEHARLAHVLTPHEAVRLARGNMSNNERRRIEARCEGFGMLNGQVFSLVSLQEAMDMLGVHLEEDEVEEVSELQGFCAYTGCVQGDVCLILKNEDLIKFQAGQILVTQMTNPNFVSVMKQARAIVTDEGGVTCHAAIVAREFGIPCLVGTKIGTKVFKDGDRVEVDAEKGIVRKL
jgi:phosphohistidine swiveling domain-containing protein